MYLLCLSFARQFGKCGAELESGHYLIGEDHGLDCELNGPMDFKTSIKATRQFPPSVDVLMIVALSSHSS